MILICDDCAHGDKPGGSEPCLSCTWAGLPPTALRPSNWQQAEAVKEILTTAAPTIEQEIEDAAILSIASEGRKDDGEKVRLDLIPPELLFAVGDILTYGAAKYAPRNWERGMSWGRVFGALMRHMWAWLGGEKGDPDTGRSHLWHAACCIAFLIAYEQRGAGTDDRPEARA